MPFWSQLQGTEFWPQTGQPQQWSTPRSPLGLTGPPPTTLQGMSANDWQSPLPPPPTWDANAPGFGGGDGGRQDASLTGWNASGKGYKGGVMPLMEISDGDPIPKWDFQEPGARLKPWLRELSFWRHDTSTPVNKQGVKLYKALPLGTVGRSLADQISEDQICSGRGFDLIVGAIRHHFRSYLEAEPEVQAEIALYQTTRSPKGTSVEYTSRISNKLREMESGFKELLPPKLKGFIIKRQAKLTHDQAKHLHFYIPTRGLEADKMVDALNRLDQTDALVEQILGDRAKLEHHANRGHAQSKKAMRWRVRWKLKLPRQPNRTTTITTKQHRTRRVISWIGIPKEFDDDGYPLVDENGSTLVPVPREGPLDEDEASSLTAWAQGYREVQKNLRDSVTGRGYYKPESSRLCAKLCSKRNHRDETETSALHSETKREITAQNVALEPS